MALDITIFYTYHRFEQQGLERRISGMLQQVYGTASQLTDEFIQVNNFSQFNRFF